MTHLHIEPGSVLGRSPPLRQWINLFVHHLGRTKERMLRSRYLGAGRLSVVDKYYKSSYQKIIIIIIFPTRPTAWSPLSVHQAINPSIVPFYNRLHKRGAFDVTTSYSCSHHEARVSYLLLDMWKTLLISVGGVWTQSMPNWISLRFDSLRTGRDKKRQSYLWRSAE